MSWPYREAQEHFKVSDPTLYALTQAIDFAYADDRPAPERSVFDSLVEAIVYQSVSLASAAAVYDRLLGLYGDDVSPDRLLATSEETLRQIGLSYRKASYLKDLAQKVAAGLPTTETLRHAEDDDAIRTLTSVKGVGPWTAQMFLLFTLHRPDVLPLKDVGLQIAAGKLYGLDRKMTPAELAIAGERWRPYCSIASIYLWQSRGEQHVEFLQQLG